MQKKEDKKRGLHVTIGQTHHTIQLCELSNRFYLMSHALAEAYKYTSHNWETNNRLLCRLEPLNSAQESVHNPDTVYSWEKACKQQQLCQKEYWKQLIVSQNYLIVGKSDKTKWNKQEQTLKLLGWSCCQLCVPTTQTETYFKEEAASL